MCHELRISEKRFKKYRKQLENYGYLSIKRNRTDNGFSKNIYSIEHNPVSGSFVPVQNVSGNSVPRRFVPEQNVGTTSNSTTSNSNTNNSENNNSSSKQQSPFDFYQANGFGVLKPYISDQIGAWIDDFEQNGNEIVIEAMKESLNNNVYKWNYVNSILKSWFNDGIRSIDDISARNNKRSKQEEIADEDNPYLKYMNS
ncbi:DnaD domain protein [Mammaliicoccus sciuri]|nr:DnaD domain protein [Mammaliicoccus sciuri]